MTANLTDAEACAHPFSALGIDADGVLWCTACHAKPLVIQPPFESSSEPPHCPTCSCAPGNWGERTCTWIPLELGRYEACVSIHDVSQCDDGTDALPAFCEDCGGKVVVQPSSAPGNPNG